MYTLIELYGTTEPTLKMKLLGTYEEFDDAKESMAQSVYDIKHKLVKNSEWQLKEGVDFERKLYHMGAHVFYHDLFWQWVIFDNDSPLEWNSLLSW